jgi:hypothetical protein
MIRKEDIKKKKCKMTISKKMYDKVYIFTFTQHFYKLL